MLFDVVAANENPAGSVPAGIWPHGVLTPPEKATGRTYFNELLIDVNLSLRLVPRPFTTAIIASAMPAAISPYSIAVAPDWSDKNLKKVRFKPASSGVPLERFNAGRSTHEHLSFAKPARINLPTIVPCQELNGFDWLCHDRCRRNPQTSHCIFSAAQRAGCRRCGCSKRSAIAVDTDPLP